MQVIEPFVGAVLQPDVENSAGDRVVGDPGRAVGNDESVRRALGVRATRRVDHRRGDVDAVVVDARVVSAQIVEQGSVAAAPVIERAAIGVDELRQLGKAKELALFSVPVDPLWRSSESGDFPGVVIDGVGEDGRRLFGWHRVSVGFPVERTVTL